MNVHFIWSKNIQNDSIPQPSLVKALYKCDSLNTIFKTNLLLCEKKDSLYKSQIIFERYKTFKSDSLRIEDELKFNNHIKTLDKQFKKNKRNSNIKTGIITSIILFTFGLII